MKTALSSLRSRMESRLQPERPAQIPPATNGRETQFFGALISSLFPSFAAVKIFRGCFRGNPEKFSTEANEGNEAGEKTEKYLRLSYNSTTGSGGEMPLQEGFCPAPATNRRHAFTLIEIMVVVGIMGLMLTMGIPAFVRALHKEGMRKAESDLLEACQKARGGAIIKAATQELIFRPMDKSFEAPGAFPLTVLPQDISIQSISLNGMLIAPEDADVIPVRFFSRGTSDEFTIVIRSDQDGTICTVTLDEVTALADISTSR